MREVKNPWHPWRYWYKNTPPIKVKKWIASAHGAKSGTKLGEIFGDTNLSVFVGEHKANGLSDVVNNLFRTCYKYGGGEVWLRR